MKNSVGDMKNKFEIKNVLPGHIFDYAPDEYIILDQRGAIVYLNKPAELFFKKIMPGSEPGYSALQTLPGFPDKARLIELMENAGSYSFRSHYSDPEKAIHHIKVNYNSFFERGETYFLIHLSTMRREDVDLTCRCLERDRYEYALKGVTEGIWDWQVGSGALFFSNQVAHITGYPKESELSTNALFWKYMHEEDAKMLFRVLKRSVISHEKIKHVCRIITPSDEIRYVLIQGVPVSNKSGSRAHRIVGSVTDQTDSVKKDNALKARKEELNKVLNTAGSGIAMTDENDKIIEFNPKLAQLLQTEDLLGAKFEEYLSESDKYKEHLQLQKVKMGKIYEYQLDVKLMVHETKSFDARLRKSFIFYENGNIKNTVLVVDDISHDLTREHDLNVARQKAEESDRLKTAFLANLSHEIRTPLNGVVGFSSLLERENVSKDSMLMYTKIIKSSANTLLRVIDDIIDVSMLQSGLIKLQYRRFNLKNFCDNFEVDVKTRAEEVFEKEIELVCSAPQHKLELFQDEIRLKQVLINLVDNGIKFSEKPKVEVGYKLINPSEIQFYVKDNGPGIDANAKDKIFESFRQQEATLSRNYGGTGIGLTIAKSLVDQMGGRLWFESQPGKGSTFFFSVPFSNPDVNRTLTDYFQDYNQDKMVDWRGKSILLVEDDVISCEYYKTIFEDTGVNLAVANTSAEAAKFLSRNEPDLILMDILLPDKNGLTLSEEILEKKPDMPIIVQSAYNTKKDIDRSLTIGCRVYIPKPIDISFILKVIDLHFQPAG